MWEVDALRRKIFRKIADSGAEPVPAAPVERMLELVWTVAQHCERTRAGARRQARRVLSRVDWSNAEQDPRGLRQRVINGLAERWQRVDQERFRRAVRQAVVVDEFAQLPEQQRRVLDQVIFRHRSVEQVAGEAGLRHDDVCKLLRQSLRDISAAAASAVPERDPR